MYEIHIWTLSSEGTMMLSLVCVLCVLLAHKAAEPCTVCATEFIFDSSLLPIKYKCIPVAIHTLLAHFIHELSAYFYCSDCILKQ